MALQAPTIYLIFVSGLNLAWLVTFRRLRPARQQAEPWSAPDQPKPPQWGLLQTRFAGWLRQNRAESALVLFGTCLGLAVALTGPRSQLTSTRAPLFALHYLRDFQLNQAATLGPLLALLGGSAALALTVYAQRSRSFLAARAGMLICGLSLASLGQLAVLGDYPDPAGVLYVLAIVFFAVWAWAWSGDLAPDLIRHGPPTWPELAVLGAVLGITLLARFHRLGTIPLGIEGDESRWTVEVVHAMVDGNQPFGTEYHLASVPVSFYMQALFQRAFGPGIHSGRLAVATFSVLGGLAAYWAARQLTGPPVAALATFLLGISIFDISASRLANVESHVKLWPVLAIGLLAYATRRRRLFTYVLAGTAVAIGMLTYDTAWPGVAVGGAIVLLDLWAQRAELGRSVRLLTAYLVPQLLVLPITLAYAAGRVQYYAVDRRWAEGDWHTALEHLSDLLDSLFRATHGDFLYNRFGPLFNSLLLPWLVLGTVLALYHWRRQRMLWVLLFAGAFFLPAPVLTGAPAGRVLYPALPAAYLLIGIAMWATFRELLRVLGPAWKPLLMGIGACALGYLALLNLYIYFNEVRDFSDRELRRELYEIARTTARFDWLTVYPYMPEVGDPLEHEAAYAIWLGYRSRMETLQLAQIYSAYPIAQLDQRLPSAARSHSHVEIVWPNFLPEADEQRTAAMAWLQECFPGIRHVSGQFYDRYLVVGTVRADSPCLEAGG